MNCDTKYKDGYDSYGYKDSQDSSPETQSGYAKAESPHVDHGPLNLKVKRWSR